MGVDQGMSVFWVSETLHRRGESVDFFIFYDWYGAITTQVRDIGVGGGIFGQT